MRVETNSRKLIKIVRADGWRGAGVRGVYHYFTHPTKLGTLRVAHPRRSLPLHYARKILRDAGLLKMD